MQMICQKMTKGAITHDVTLYAHDELITLLRDPRERAARKACRFWAKSCI